MQQTLLPVLLGADMNCYSMARTFHEAYGVTSQVFGRYAMGEIKYSRILNFTAVDNIDTDAVLISTLENFAAAHPDKTKILIGCTDDYAALLIRNKTRLSKNYTVPYIDESLMNRLVSKESFYALCEEYDIPYPKTFILRPGQDTSALDNLSFQYPIILKPSSSIEYWKNPFDNMKKVYMPATPNEAKQIAKTIFASGYTDYLILQDTIPGPDDHMHVLTAYSDKDAKVKMMCLGNVLLEEHTPRAIGNHAAILTEYNRPLMDKLKNFLEAIGYTGFSNFDIKYDERDKTYRVFEINLRQGRSNYYVTGAGLNLAEYLVKGHVQAQDLGAPLFFDKQTFWHSIPASIVWNYTQNRTLVAQAQAITKIKQDTTTLAYPFDLKGNPLRRLYLWEHNRRYHKKYATYCKKYNKNNN